MLTRKVPEPLPRHRSQKSHQVTERQVVTVNSAQLCGISILPAVGAPRAVRIRGGPVLLACFSEAGGERHGGGAP